MNGKIRLVALLTALLMLFQTIALAEVVTTVDDYNTLLQSRIEQFVNGTPEVQYAILMALETDEQRESMLKLLSEEQYSALVDCASSYIASLEQPVYKTVNFTHAGPFMPPVNVSGIAKMRLMRAVNNSMTNSAVKNDAVYTSKTVTGNANDGYKLRLETYVTGETIVETIEKSIPVDIVLVLDQSGSMAFDFSGNRTSTNSDRRQYAMKIAVNNFISSVADKYNAEESDHRISIVTFASSSSKLQDWTYVNADGKNTLTSKINGLPEQPSGATNVAAGMTQASTLLGSGYSYSGTNTQRQKVVIVFTDGVPTTSSDFNTGVADSAIATAKSMKENGATIYTIGIFNGANPNVLYGSESGDVGEYWQEQSFLGSGDVSKAAEPAGNRFLNYLSSNFQHASVLGLERSSLNIVLYAYERYTITQNAERTGNGYYLTADNSESLKDIFQSISDNIQTGQSNIALGSSTAVKDIITDSFQLSTNANAGGIKVYTSDYTKNKTWTADAESGLTASVSGSMVSVTGFDFAKNFVDLEAANGRNENDATQSGSFYGRKLIIEIPIEVKPGFLGGNNVPTNGDESGVYTGSGDDASCVENFDVPQVNVPIADVTVNAADKNVYLLGGLTQAQMLAGSEIKCGNVAIDPTDTVNYGLAPWQHAYVDISCTIPSDQNNLEVDSNYTISCTVSPKTKIVADDAATEKSASKTPRINVFLPEMTFADSVVEYLSTHTFPTYFEDTTEGNNYRDVVWKHGETKSTDSGVTMTGPAPKLDLTYTYNKDSKTNIEIVETGENSVVGKIIATADIPVDVAVKIGDRDVTSHVTFEHLCHCDLDQQCGWNKESGAEFLLHVKDIVANLTITKTGLDKYAYAGDVDQEMAIFTVTVTTKNGEEKYTIALANGQSATIKDVLVGKDYTITEQNGWTWRYEYKDPINGTMAVGGKSETINNDADNPYWLGGDNYAVNVFGTTSTGEAGND